MQKDAGTRVRARRFDLNSNQRLYAIITSILVAAVILIFYAFPDYVPDAGAKGAVEIAFADNISAAHRKVIDLFNREHKGKIRVIPVNLPFSKFSTDDRKELLARYFRSKSDRIDIFSVDQVWVPRFARWCVPLDKYIPENEVATMSKYAAHSCYFRGQLVAAPLYLDIAVMFYRKDLMQKVPDHDMWIDKLEHSITWDDFFRLHSVMGKDSGPFFVYQAKDFEGLVCMYTELLSNLHSSIMKDGKPQLETPQAEKALQFLVDLVNKYHASPEQVTNFREDDSYKFFLKNNGVFLRGWPGFARDESLQKEFPANYPECVPAPLPHMAGAKPAYVFGGWNLMISRYSTKIPEAVTFLRFLGSKQSQEIMYEDGGYLPSNTRVYSDSTFMSRHPELKFYENLFKDGVYRPFSPAYTGISDVLSYYLNLAIKKELSPRMALTEATQEIDSGKILIK